MGICYYQFAKALYKAIGSVVKIGEAAASDAVWVGGWVSESGNESDAGSRTGHAQQESDTSGPGQTLDRDKIVH